MTTARLNVFAAAAALFLCSCAQVPEREFAAYTEAFSQFTAVAQEVLVDYDSAMKERDARRAELDRKKATSPARPKLPFPSKVAPNTLAGTVNAKDDIGVRRQALEVIARYNATMTALAAGKEPEKIGGAVDSLVGNLELLNGLIGAAAIPLGPVAAAAPLIKTVLTKLEQASNRREFAEALREAEPIIVSIFDLFANDAENFYVIRYRQRQRIWLNLQARASSKAGEILSVAKDIKPPLPDEKKKLKEIEGKAKLTLARIGVATDDFAMRTTGNAAFSGLIQSQLAQTLTQLDDIASRYETTIATQAAYYKLVTSYMAMLSQAKRSLKSVRAALDAPQNIRAQAIELIGFAFAAKRDVEAYRRASAAR